MATVSGLILAVCAYIRMYVPPPMMRKVLESSADCALPMFIVCRNWASLAVSAFTKTPSPSTRTLEKTTSKNSTTNVKLYNKAA